jgi:hypothetical protein
MKYIIDSEGYYIGFGGPNTELSEGQQEVAYPPEEGFLQPKWFQETWVEGAPQEDLNVSNDEKRGQRIKNAYEQRKADGWEAYQDFRANMVKEIYDGTITKQQAFIIEDFLGKGYDKIAQQGDWETAYYKLSTTTIPETYAFVQSYLDNAKTIMLNYIQLNYKPM